MKLVHLVGFITKKFVTMHGHMNIKCKTLLLMIKFIDQKRSTLVSVIDTSHLSRMYSDAVFNINN